MTLVVETHGGKIWLCLRRSPLAAHSELLARFVTAEAAEDYKTAFAQSICFAREVGRSGLG